MKHLSVKLEGTPEHDAKGFFCKVFNDRAGAALAISEEDAVYWIERLRILGLEATAHSNEGD